MSCRFGEQSTIDGVVACHHDAVPHGLVPAAVCWACRFREPGSWQSPITDHRSPITPGPGTALKRILAALGIRVAGCSCNSHAAQMDAHGAMWCLRNIPRISRWLMDEADRRHLPMRGDWPLGCALLIVAAVAWSFVRRR